MSRLLYMIRWQPTEGDLFTAQTPLFAITIAATVAIYQSDRKMVEDWFKATMDGSRGVSSLIPRLMKTSLTCAQNVKPLWDTIQQLWEWQEDSEEIKADHVDDPLRAHPWWEHMVDKIVRRFGRLNLA